MVSTRQLRRQFLVWCYLVAAVSTVTHANSPQLVAPPRQPQRHGLDDAFAKRLQPQQAILPSPTPRTADSAWVGGMKNSLASALAAGCSKIILAPLDTIKTLQQHSRSSVSADPLSMIGAAKVILSRPKGFWELYVSCDYCCEEIRRFFSAFLSFSFLFVTFRLGLVWQW
jgi:hypothetical protein